jgi:hypothetical protein
MSEEVDPLDNTRRSLREPDQHHSEERLFRPEDGADRGGALSELEDLPGVVSVTLNTLTSSFDIIYDPAIVSDDELAAALQHEG